MTSLKIKILTWEKESLEKTLEHLEIKFLATKNFPEQKAKVIKKYKDKIKILEQKIISEKLKELRE